MADKRLPYEDCMLMSIRDIRQTKEYASLTPMGKKNDTGKYRFGNKSYMNKKDLCKALNDPDAYHKKIEDLKKKGENAGPRKRPTREGECPVHRNKKECMAPHPHKGLTTTGKSCCYKKKQSDKVLEKRIAEKKRREKAKNMKKSGSKKKSASKKKSSKRTSRK